MLLNFNELGPKFIVKEQSTKGHFTVYFNLSFRYKIRIATDMKSGEILNLSGIQIVTVHSK